MHRKNRFQTQIILLGTIAVLIFIFYTAVKIYKIAVEETKSNYQAQQREMATTASAGINNYLKHLESDLYLLESFPCVQNFTRPLLQTNVFTFFENARHQAVKAILVVDSKADLVYSTSASMPTKIYSIIKHRLLDNYKPDEYAWYSPVFETVDKNSENELSFLVLIPIIKRESTRDFHVSKTAIGLLGYWISFNWLVEQYVEPISIGRSGFAWLIDSRGKLLFHPTHPEMVLRSTTQLDHNCQPCHASFEMQNYILNAPAGNAKYEVAPEPVKLMAHVPIQLQNERWILVVSTSLPEVTALLRDKFLVFFVLVMIIASVILGASFLLYDLNTRRIRAEEAQRFIEKKEELQSQINQAAKLASIGELIDSVAHEINTPASIISVNLDALKYELTQTGKNNYEEIRIIKEQTRRIGNYIRTLLNYSRRMPFHPAPVQITKLIDECLYLLGHRFRAQKITIEKNFAKRLPDITLDYRQMEQVLINLLNNAVDAIPKSGTITIGIYPAGVSGLTVKITDTGEGILPENLPEIFKPFFSTKRPSKGTGLGLSISKAIIQRHQGNISVRSEINQGTTFEIFLPFHNSEESSKKS